MPQAVSPEQQGSTFCPQVRHCTWPCTDTGSDGWWHSGQRQGADEGDMAGSGSLE